MELFVLDSSTRNHLIVCDQKSLGSFKNITKKCVYKSYIFNIYA